MHGFTALGLPWIGDQTKWYEAAAIGGKLVQWESCIDQVVDAGGMPTSQFRSYAGEWRERQYGLLRELIDYISN